MSVSDTDDERRWPLGDLGDAVSGTVWNLQRGLLTEHREAGTVAVLARLRRAVSAEPGSVPEVWSETIGAVPTSLQGTEGANAAERAAHAAVTLFALHQQGKPTPMHRAGGSLGSAARKLVVSTDREDAIRRRFQSIALADSEAGIVHHLRSLVTLLRASDIPLDYGRLADDLRTLFGRRGADTVRLRWGRDFNARPAKHTDASGTDDQTDSEES